ncbi:response regulator transcription factor [Gordonia aurantiaca]|uniref:response regulator transcription factor n=1 Tax=Gordonia sp. B21 TaxID=3151852 RepID=UPI0032666369
MATLLLIEDDERIVEGLSLALELLGHSVSHLPGACADLEDRVAAADAVLLDLGLPGDDGFAICRRIRTTSPVPVIILTARSDDVDTVAGLEAGADDYVVKPVSPRVLDARIKAAMRRVVHAETPGATVVEAPSRDTGIVVDPVVAEVFRDGEPLPLTPIEKRLMFAFDDHVGQVLSREQLLAMVWNQDFLGDSRLVDNAILRLRGKLDRPGEETRIETVRGFGYRYRGDR